MATLRIALVLFLTAVSPNAASPKDLALAASRGDAAATQALRAMGQAGVDAMLALPVPERGASFEAAIDQVCRQRDCLWSGLYWHTDLEAAKQVARTQRRPILSLRLLGNLDEELSCANSRYFRTLLYSNREIRQYLRANYVLHWQSVRPAPVVTIDFGDGRRMQRTVTGNSIHYVLDHDGYPLDAIPGLYSPPAFLGMLEEGSGIFTRVGSARNQSGLAAWHSAAMNTAGATAAGGSRRDAATAGARAMTKAVTEAPMIQRVSYGPAPFDLTTRIASRMQNAVAGQTIDDSSRSLIRAKRLAAPDPALRSDEAIDQALATLERALAADTLTNESELHAKIHEWFARGEVTTVDALNTRVYDELFLTPSSDPWLGLMMADAFTAISGEGLSTGR